MNSRELAFNILFEVIYEGAYSNLSISKNLKKFNSQKDENFIRELVYGVLENKIYIDYVLSKLSKKSLKKVQKNILIILEMGIYQMLFMDSVPDRAAVNESVELVKSYGNKGARGFVNGILRNFSRNKNILSQVLVTDKLEKLSIETSHPLWLVEYFNSQFGYEFTKELCKANNGRGNFTIRVNTSKTTREELKLKFEKYDIEAIDTMYSRDSLVIKNPKNITSLKDYKEGLFTIQDESSSLVGQVMNPKEGGSIIDLCAAPGGKTCHMGELMRNKGCILAGDIHKHRVDLIKENAKRLEIDIIETMVIDAGDLMEDYIGRFDYCLVDAPCSGLGTIRKNPEIKFNKSIEDINELVDIQRNILNTSKNYLKNGGILIYSTCTIGKRENDMVVDEFLKENKNFKLIDIEIEGLETDKGYLKLYPHIHNTEGFFIAKMVKVE